MLTRYFSYSICFRGISNSKSTSKLRVALPDSTGHGKQCGKFDEIQQIFRTHIFFPIPFKDDNIYIAYQELMKKKKIGQIRKKTSGRLLQIAKMCRLPFVVQ